MAFVNPLDKVPQIPRDWANHIIYGGALGAAFSFLAGRAGIPDALEFGAAATLIVAAMKKAVDYMEEGESALECIGKTFVTAVWPATLAIAGAL